MAWKDLSNSEKLVRIFSSILAVLLIIVLVLIKLSNPEFKFGLMLLIALIIVFFFVMVMFAFHWWTKRNKLDREKDNSLADGKLPPAITIEQCRDLVKLQLQNPMYADYSVGSDGEENELLGEKVKSYVYTYRGRGVYSKDKYVVVMNRHYPNETLNVLINPSIADINRAKNKAATTPEKEPDVKETTQENVLTGTKVVTRETKHSTEEDKKKSDL